MKETIFKIFDTFTEGVDTYYHNGSMWLIFTDEQKWVIELAQDGILWYNSYFFGDCLKYVSLNVVDNQHYITEWVENIVQKDIERTELSTAGIPFRKKKSKEVIQNGVKSTRNCILDDDLQVENIIQTNHCSVSNDKNAKDALQSGVRVTKALGPSEVTEKEINRVIKETHEDVFKSNARVWGVVNNGIKQTIELPDMSDETNGYGYYYERQKDKTYPHAYIVNDVINGK